MASCASPAVAGAVSAQAQRMPVLAIPHGGGPCFQLPDGALGPRGLWAPMQRYLEGVSASLRTRPKAILMCVRAARCALTRQPQWRRGCTRQMS
jgi:hypothetical protein